MLTTFFLPSSTNQPRADSWFVATTTDEVERAVARFHKECGSNPDAAAATNGRVATLDVAHARQLHVGTLPLVISPASHLWHATSQVPRGNLEAGVCWFTFDELCGSDLGAADYQAIANSFVRCATGSISLIGHDSSPHSPLLYSTLYSWKASRPSPCAVTTR